MKSLIRRLASAALIVLATLFMLAPAHAQEDDGRARLVQAIASERMSNLMFERDIAKAWTPMMMREPEIAQIEVDCPGYVEGLIVAIRPILSESHNYDFGWYRTELEALFRAELSDAHASGMADLLGSDLGQRVLLAAVENYEVENSVEDAVTSADNSVSAAALAADREATAQRLVTSLAREDVLAFGMQVMQAPWRPEFERIQPRIHDLQLQLANRDFTPEHGAQFDKIVSRYAEDAITACYNGK